MPAEERREQILDAAEVAFSTRGYRDVGTAEVAAQARVSEPTLYRYFASKRDLYLAMLERNADRLLATWREIAAASADAMTGLSEIGRWYFEQLQKNPTPFLLRARSLLEVAADEKLANHSRKNFWEPSISFRVSTNGRASRAKFHAGPTPAPRRGCSWPSAGCSISFC